MKVKVCVEFTAQWVLSKSREGRLPVEQFVEELRSRFTAVSVERRSFTECVAFVEGDNADAVRRTVEAVLQGMGVPNDGSVTRLLIGDGAAPAAAPAAPAAPASAPAAGGTEAVTDFLRGVQNGGAAAPAAAPAAPAAPGSSTVMAEVENLIGVEEFKQLCRELVALAPQVHALKAEATLASRHYLFSASAGCGMSTYAGLLAKLLKEQCLFFEDGEPAVVELSLEMPAGDRERSAMWEKLGQLSNNRRAGKRLLLCDISAWMQHENNVLFREVLTFFKNLQNTIMVFQVPFLEQSALEMMEKSVGDLFFLRTVVVTPFSDTEFMEYARKRFEAIHMTMADNAWHVFCSKLWEEKSDGRFYGMHTVDKIINEIVLTKLQSNMQAGTSSTEITDEDIRRILREPDDTELSGMDMLDRLIGIDMIKQRIAEIVAQIEWQQEMAKNDKQMARPCLHMRFVGNPGTGKTTVARIVGKIFRERGILRIGALHEVARRDLCGQYIGETAPKTTEVCRSAYGSVLFIDEAYSLYTGERDSRDYGREAIDTLIAEMENHRDDMVVIMAGYPDDMDKLLEANAGLAGRMPFTIEFPNYTREELVKIFFLMVGNDLEYDDAFRKAVENFFMSISDEQYNSRFFSNARLARNLLDRISSKAAMRRRLNRDPSMRLLAEDVQQAISDEEFRDLAGKRGTTMGFRLGE